MITVNVRLVTWWKTGAAPNVWMHGLYVHPGVSQGTPADYSLVYWNPARTQAFSEATWLWLTDVTAQGVNQGLSARSPVYAEGLPPFFHPSTIRLQVAFMLTRNRWQYMYSARASALAAEVIEQMAR